MPRFIYPPRPKLTIPPFLVSEYDAQGEWVAQLKFDGDRCVTVVEDGNVHLANRHGKFHPSFKFPLLRREISNLNLPAGTHCLDGELLSNQTLVLYDILQYGEYLIGWNQIKRLALLAELCQQPKERCAEGIALQVSPHLWLAEQWTNGFDALFKQYISHRLIEGLVLRNAKALLDTWGTSESNDVPWQIRCRRPSKKYRF